jgi:hypothetical protein
MPELVEFTVHILVRSCSVPPVHVGTVTGASLGVGEFVVREFDLPCYIGWAF